MHRLEHRPFSFTPVLPEAGYRRRGRRARHRPLDRDRDAAAQIAVRRGARRAALRSRQPWRAARASACSSELRSPWQGLQRDGRARWRCWQDAAACAKGSLLASAVGRRLPPRRRHGRDQRVGEIAPGIELIGADADLGLSRVQLHGEATRTETLPRRAVAGMKSRSGSRPGSIASVWGTSMRWGRRCGFGHQPIAVFQFSLGDFGHCQICPGQVARRAGQIRLGQVRCGSSALRGLGPMPGSACGRWRRRGRGQIAVDRSWFTSTFMVATLGRDRDLAWSRHVGAFPGRAYLCRNIAETARIARFRYKIGLVAAMRRR